MDRIEVTDCDVNYTDIEILNRIAFANLEDDKTSEMKSLLYDARQHLSNYEDEIAEDNYDMADLELGLAVQELEIYESVREREFDVEPREF